MIKAVCTPQGFDNQSAQATTGMSPQIEGSSCVCLFPGQITGQDGEGGIWEESLSRDSLHVVCCYLPCLQLFKP